MEAPYEYWTLTLNVAGTEVFQTRQALRRGRKILDVHMLLLIIQAKHSGIEEGDVIDYDEDEMFNVFYIKSFIFRSV